MKRVYKMDWKPTAQYINISIHFLLLLPSLWLMPLSNTTTNTTTAAAAASDSTEKCKSENYRMRWDYREKTALGTYLLCLVVYFTKTNELLIRDLFANFIYESVQCAHLIPFASPGNIHFIRYLRKFAKNGKPVAAGCGKNGPTNYCADKANFASSAKVRIYGFKWWIQC